MNGSGFPFDFHFVFFILILISLVGFAQSYFIGEEHNKGSGDSGASTPVEGFTA
jgi:hypothetical protein